jgi:predicted 3-demethylubiquinone-9 3-methyltransferase (glyoxalase superfamily)
VTNHRIIPHLWFDKEAKEAAEFYVSAFGGNSAVKKVVTIEDTPSGSTYIVTFDILGQEFNAISAGPYFKINPSISFHVKCGSVGEVDEIWEKLSEGGTILMDLGEYPFSKRYGWVEDRFGVSWQVFYAEGDFLQRITPILMFTQDVCGKAEEAMNYYGSVFPEASALVLARYDKGEEPDREGTVKYGQLILNGHEFGAMDSARSHDFTFNEAVSLIVNCKDQDEIDYYWEKLSAVPESEQCGWLKDKFGVSWQIVPENMNELMERDMEKVTPVILAMKKIIIADLITAAEED